MAKSKVIYLINPAGCMHKVTREHARAKMKESAGYRPATKEQIAKYYDARDEAKQKKKSFIQSHEKPLFAPWTPEPPEDQELPDQALPVEQKEPEEPEEEPAISPEAE